MTVKMANLHEQFNVSYIVRGSTPGVWSLIRKNWERPIFKSALDYRPIHDPGRPFLFFSDSVFLHRDQLHSSCCSLSFQMVCSPGMLILLSLGVGENASARDHLRPV